MMMRGMGNMQGMMKQVQKMQKEMAAAKETLDAQVFEAEAGNGLVKITMTGEKKVTSIEINPDVLDPGDPDMVQDLVLDATNKVIEKIDVETERVMGKYAKAIPGL